MPLIQYEGAVPTALQLELIQRKKRQTVSSPSQDDEDDSLGDFKWTLMGFTACIPGINWTAWILAGFDTSSAASFYLYQAFWLLHVVPVVASGANVSSWTLWLGVLLCALHVQVERLAQTEPWALLQVLPPEKYDQLRPLRSIGAIDKRDSDILMDSFWQARDVRSFAELLENSEQLQEQEKAKWDAQLTERKTLGDKGSRAEAPDVNDGQGGGKNPPQG